MTRVKTAPAAPTPADDEEANVYVAEIIGLQRSIEKMEADMQVEIEGIKGQYEQRVKGVRATLNDRLKALQTYCEAHRPRLLKKGKSVELPAGRVGWRMTPQRVVLDNPKAVLEYVKSLQSEDHVFFRTKYAIDKQAMLAAPKVAEKIPGVTITQDEEFFIEATAPKISEDTAL